MLSRTEKSHLRRHRLQKQRDWSSLLLDLLASNHARLTFLDRLAFTAVFGAVYTREETPWLVLPEKHGMDTATLFSLADRHVATFRAPELAMQDYAILGSSCGWLVTADDRGRMHLVNPVTAEQHQLPDITTMSIYLHKPPYYHFSLEVGDIRDDDEWGAILGKSTSTCTATEIRTYLYRKVVLSYNSPRPASYAAMLILGRQLGDPAFVTAEDPAWRLAPSRNAAEDAIHHRGRFYSITYSGIVEAWVHNASNKFMSTMVAPMLQARAKDESLTYHHSRKYLVAAPGDRLMVVLKQSRRVKNSLYGRDTLTWSFKVWVPDYDAGGEVQWKEAADIGEAVLFVGANNSLLVSTGEHPKLKAGCIYFTDDELRPVPLVWYDDPDIKLSAGVYSLKDGTVEKIDALERQRRSPPPAWLTPS